MALGVVGVLTSSTTFVWVNRLIDHPFLLGTAAAGCVGTGLFWLQALGRRALLVSCVAVGLPWGALALFLAPVLTNEARAVVAAPPGPVDYEVVVREATDGWIDPAWVLSIRQRDGLLAREWSVGCISGDASNHAYEGVLWERRSRLTVVTDRGPVVVPVDTNTGKPLAVTGYPWNTC